MSVIPNIYEVGNKFRVQINFKGKKYCLGLYGDKYVAAKVLDNAKFIRNDKTIPDDKKLEKIINCKVSNRELPKNVYKHKNQYEIRFVYNGQEYRKKCSSLKKATKQADIIREIIKNHIIKDDKRFIIQFDYNGIEFVKKAKTIKLAIKLAKKIKKVIKRKKNG